MTRILHISLLSFICMAQCIADNIIRNGVPWFDTDGNIVNAHGACIVEDGGKFWLFGEYATYES